MSENCRKMNSISEESADTASGQFEKISEYSTYAIENDITSTMACPHCVLLIQFNISAQVMVDRHSNPQISF